MLAPVSSPPPGQRFLFIVLALLSMAWPISAPAETLGFSLSDTPPQASPSAPSLPFAPQAPSTRIITVLDDLTLAPIEGAKVQVSDNPGDLASPAGNWVRTPADWTDAAPTDANGTVQAPDSGASGPWAVTVTKDGYAAVSLLGIMSRDATLYLRRTAPATGAILSGTMGDYQVPEDSGDVYGGLVFRAPSAYDLLRFDMTSIISPLKDTIDVMGRREVPSNLVLPPQSIPVLFTSVDLDKPEYQLPLTVSPPGAAPTTLAGLQCRISVDDAISIASGGTISPSILRKIHFTRLGISPAIQVTDGASQDVPATLDLQTANQVTVPVPPFQSEVVVAALADLNGDRQTLIPMDIASPSGGSGVVSIRSTSSELGEARGVVAIAMTPKADLLSGVVDLEEGAAGPGGLLRDFLDASPLPDYQSLPPSVPIQGNPNSVTTVTFETRGQDSEGITRSAPVWTIYALPSAGDAAIPTGALPGNQEPSSYSEMRLEFSSLDEHAVDGLTIIRKLTRFTRSTARSQGR